MNKNATDLSVIAAKSALQSAKLNPEKIDNVIFGHVLPVCIVNIIFIYFYKIYNYYYYYLYFIFFIIFIIIIIIYKISSSDGGFLTRHVALKSGIPLEKPSFSLNRLCGSGFQSIVSGAQVDLFAI